MQRHYYIAFLTLALFLPLAEWWDAVRPAEIWASPTPLPKGQTFFMAAKLFGMLAISLAMAQIILSAMGRLGAPGFARADHLFLGMGIGLSAAIHVGCFVTAVSLRNGHLAAQLLLPNLTNGAYDRGLAMGVLGLYLLALGLAVPLLRLRWRRLHRAVLAAVLLAMVHAIWIGSEKTYVIAMALVGGAVILFEASRRLSRRHS